MAPNWISTAKVLPKSSSSKPKKCSHQQQVAGRGHRQELGQALDDAEDEGLEQIEQSWEGSAGRGTGAARIGRGSDPATLALFPHRELAGKAHKAAALHRLLRRRSMQGTSVI